MSKDDKPTKLEPRLRFPEFKGGPGWDTPAMSDLYGFRSTNSLSRDQLNYDTGSIYNIHYGDIHTQFQTQFRLEHERVPFIDPAVAEELGDRFSLCREGDIILADASEDLNDVGKAIELISLCGHRVVAGTHTIHATRLDANPVVGFGGYLFKSAGVRRGIHKEAQGAKVYGISSNRIAAVRLPLPRTTDEQRKIAECLGSLDDWIAAETEALAALRRHKTGLMQQLFPRPGETRPRLRFPEFKDGPAWDTPAMSDVYRFRPTNSLSRDQLNYHDGILYNIHYGDIHTKFQSQFRLENERVPRVLPAIAEELGDRFHLCQEGDIILADASEDLNDVGKAIELISLDGRSVAAGTHTIHATRLADKPAAGFGGYLFQSAPVRRGIQKEAQGAKVYGISPTRIASVLLPMPRTTTEQSKIAECLGSLDVQIFAQSDKLAALRDHKRGLMQQLFPAPDAAHGGS